MAKSITSIENEMHSLHNIIQQEGNVNYFDLQSTCADLCIFRDENIENNSYGDTLRLADAMAKECIQATSDKMIVSRFESCYACVKELSNI